MESELKSGCGNMGSGCNMFAVAFQGILSIVFSKMGMIILLIVGGLLLFLSWAFNQVPPSIQVSQQVTSYPGAPTGCLPFFLGPIVWGLWWLLSSH